MKPATKPQPKREIEIRCFAEGERITEEQLAALINQCGGIADKRGSKR
jgi:hypothetical protein